MFFSRVFDKTIFYFVDFVGGEEIPAAAAVAVEMTIVYAKRLIVT